jgi:hypothetical protein
MVLYFVLRMHSLEASMLSPNTPLYDASAGNIYVDISKKTNELTFDVICKYLADLALTPESG